LSHPHKKQEQVVYRTLHHEEDTKTNEEMVSDPFNLKARWEILHRFSKEQELLQKSFEESCEYSRKKIEEIKTGIFEASIILAEMDTISKETTDLLVGVDAILEETYRLIRESSEMFR
jgi:hypothetical protein